MWVCLLGPGPLEGLQLGRRAAQAGAGVCMSAVPAGLAGVQHRCLGAAGAHFTPAGFCFPDGSGTTDFIVPEGAQGLFLVETAGLCRWVGETELETPKKHGGKGA